CRTPRSHLAEYRVEAAIGSSYHRHVRVHWVVLVVCVAAVARTAADPAAADHAAAEAAAAAARKDFAGAAAKFREAYAADPRPQLMCNVGVAYFKAGKAELPRAHRYLEQCLQGGQSLDAKFLANAAQVDKAVTDQLAAGDFAPVDVVVQPAIATT